LWISWRVVALFFRPCQMPSRNFETSSKIKILSVALRIGGKGSVVDNLNYGGFIVKCSINGYLADYAVNKKGEKVHLVNDIDLKRTHQIPFFSKCLDKAVIIASRNIHHRLLGLDIAIDKQNEIRIIEINNGHIGTDLPHLVGLPLFGKYTDEVIAYCKKNINKLNSEYVLRLKEIGG
ncbi:MAG: sugar-transfer associated ATP-grasp domain-containing protein, partial [Acidobacteriota bacterium]|nr:sugar-transfer associated ATP-grasp domain-containing protein [Acidobacteriota bacterium]